MRLSTLASTPGGAGSAPGEVSVTEGWGAAPGRQLRAVRYLGFACGSLAEGISLDEGSVALGGEFLPLDYDALHPPAPLAAAGVRARSGLLVVELGGVRRVRRVVLLRSARTRDAALEVFRLDGEAPASAPTVTVDAGLQMVSVELEAEEHLAVAAADAGVRAAAHGAHAHEAPDSPYYRIEDTVAFDLPDGFDDARFALGIVTRGDRPSLAVGDLLTLAVRSTPLNPRLGLALPPPPGPPPEPDPLADLLLFWPDPSSPPAPPATRVEAGALLARGLRSHLSRRVEELRVGGGPLPVRVDVALVAAADAPCRLRFDALDVDYHLERASLEPALEKAVLRFSADRVESREATVVVPRGAHVLSASVEVSESRVGAGAGGGDAAAAGPLPAFGGLVVAESDWAAQRLDLADPVMAAGLSLGLLPLVDGTEVAVEVVADVNGAPAGRRLAEATASLGAAGAPLWSGVGFGDPVLVPSGPLWVRLRAARGRAVWLAAAWGAHVEAARIGGGQDEASVLRGTEALCALRTVAAGSAAAGAGLSLEVAGRSVPARTLADGRLAFDAAAALADAAARPGSGPVTAVLRFTAQPGALLTVYPPRVTYDL